MHRTRLIFVAAIALPGSFLAGSASAQTVTAQHLLRADCGAVQGGSLPGGTGSEAQVTSASCTGLCNGVPVTMSVNDASWTRHAECGVLAASSRVFGSQLTPKPCGSGAGGESRIDQTLTATDLVFSHRTNPATTGFVTSITLNLEYRGRMVIGPGATAASMQFLVAENSVPIASGDLSLVGSAFVGGGALAAYANDGSTLLLTTNAFSEQLNVPSTVLVQLATHLRVALSESFNPTTTLNTAQSMLSLPGSGPVFNLPPDITCNSAQLCIVDNHWVPPLAATVTAVGSGCIGSNGQQVVLSAAGLPRVGNTSFALAITGPPESASTVLLFALGLAANPLQLPGNCLFFLDLPSAASLPILGPVAVSGGVAAYPLPVPVHGLLFGASFDTQGIALDPGMPIGLSTSNALSLVAGN